MGSVYGSCRRLSMFLVVGCGSAWLVKQESEDWVVCIVVVMGTVDEFLREIWVHCAFAFVVAEVLE